MQPKNLLAYIFEIKHTLSYFLTFCMDRGTSSYFLNI